MKGFTILVVIICFFISAIPVFGDSGTTTHEKTVFQKLGDNISRMGKRSPGSSQTAWTAIFQEAKTNISTWDDDTSPKSLSLRENKAELQRRRGGL